MKLDGHPSRKESRFHFSGHISGFTLIELLVVIAIIAVLAALAFPFISKMQNSGSQSKAAANFRQLGSVIMMYAADNNQTLPLLQTNHRAYYKTTPRQIGSELYLQMGLPKPTSQYQPVPLLIVPALKKWLSKYSPSDPYGGAHTVTYEITLPDGSKKLPFGYSKNDPMKIHQIPNPSKTWAVYELGGSGDPNPYMNKKYLEPVHGSTRAVLFFDGHVEVVPSDAPKPVY